MLILLLSFSMLRGLPKKEWISFEGVVRAEYCQLRGFPKKEWISLSCPPGAKDPANEFFS
jgi:hypothetical protein